LEWLAAYVAISGTGGGAGRRGTAEAGVDIQVNIGPPAIVFPAPSYAATRER